MHWRLVPGVAQIVVHTDETPSDEEWDACIAEVEEHGSTLKGVLAYTKRTGPTAAQRTKSNAIYERFGDSFKMAIMADSRMVVGIVTAMSWAVGSNVKAFSTKDFEGAADYLGIEGEDRIKVRVVLRQLARAANRDIEAFAEESGRFRRKLIE